MNHFRHQFLARTALAVDQHRQIGWRRLFGDFEGIQQFRAFTEHTLEDETAVQQSLAPLGGGPLSGPGAAGRGSNEALLARQLHDFVPQPVALDKEFLYLRPLQLRGPAQRRTKYLYLFDQTAVGNR